ncbi:MAG TPA: hypothetical protein DEO37_05145 [Aerococcaceae bacterium]|nr:hypothetical protein [Aerococcaceae bacterium]
MVDLHGKYYDGHYSHARMIQKLLSFELRDYLAIETYQHRVLSVARLNSSETDIIISTFKLTVVIDHYLSFSDLSRIKASIQMVMVLEEKAEKYGEFGFEF